MAHSHIHTQPSVQSGRLNTAYRIAMVLNLGYFAAEIIVAFVYGSSGLLSDALHKLFDVFSLLISILAFRLASSRPTDRRTFGYRKTSVLISLFNAFLLAVLVVFVIVESAEKLSDPVPVSGAAISWTAAAGIAVSGISAILLGRFQRGDINTRGAFLHMATDSLVSIGVVLSGLVIGFTGWNSLDPIVGIVISAVMLANAVKLMIESFNMCIDSVPERIDTASLRNTILSCKGVRGLDELYIWPSSVFDTELAARIRVDDAIEGIAAVKEIKSRLVSAGIQHSTIELHLTEDGTAVPDNDRQQ